MVVNLKFDTCNDEKTLSLVYLYYNSLIMSVCEREYEDMSKNIGRIVNIYLHCVTLLPLS